MYVVPDSNCPPRMSALFRIHGGMANNTLPRDTCSVGLFFSSVPSRRKIAIRLGEDTMGDWR